MDNSFFIIVQKSPKGLQFSTGVKFIQVSEHNFNGCRIFSGKQATVFGCGCHRSNITELIVQNNIFQKLDIPLDMSLNYQPNERGQDIFDVAISTQLFNNRVVVNGNLGNQQYTSGNSGSDVVGDLDIEIKLDRPGLFRLNIFSHSADQYTNYLDDSQRNGVGLAYQQEFNTFREFLENLFTGKKKRKEQAAGAVPGEAVQEKKTIIIRPDDE